MYKWKRRQKKELLCKQHHIKYFPFSSISKFNFHLILTFPSNINTPLNPFCLLDEVQTITKHFFSRTIPSTSCSQCHFNLYSNLTKYSILLPLYSLLFQYNSIELTHLNQFPMYFYTLLSACFILSAMFHSCPSTHLIPVCIPSRFNLFFSTNFFGPLFTHNS